MEFYATIAQLLPILMLAVLFESRYVERMQARLKAHTGRGLLHRMLAFYARGVLPWLQVAALGLALAGEIVAIHVLATGVEGPSLRTLLEYITTLVISVLAMGLIDLASSQL